MIINGENLILGRLATYVVKKALEGESITILNCEKVVITGPRKYLIERFESRANKGHPYDGPFYPKMPDRIIKRTLRGMLPYKQERGRRAFKRIKCFIGVPENFNAEKAQSIPNADASKLKTLNFMTINEISRFIGKGVA